jgi:uncharacterized protein YqgC (DUF456 family)
MEIHDLIAGIAIAIGLVGIVVALVPGLPLEVLAIVLWAFEEGTTLGWAVAVTAVVIALAVTVVKYLRPGKRLREAGVSPTHLLIAVVAGVVGFFVIPVVGGPLAFVAGLYLVQRARVGSERAGRSTRVALKAIAVSIGIELAGGFLIAALWLGAVLVG